MKELIDLQKNKELIQARIQHELSLNPSLAKALKDMEALNKAEDTLIQSLDEAQFEILSKAEFNKETRVIDQGSTIDFHFRFDNGSYIFSYFDVSEEEGDQAEYYFTLHNGEYRYSKMINSAMYGPPYEHK